ncbi:UNVERIFIED_CONTAM: hypothetical protein FKN15_078291 [Acipenser sinensis]
MMGQQSLLMTLANVVPRAPELPYCQLCVGFQTRTLRQRARKAVGGRSPSSWSSHTISAPPSSALTPPVTAQPPRSPSSQLTAGQRSPARRARERSRSPSSRGARPRRESRSRSRSPRRRRYSRSPRRGRLHQDTSGVAELTSKMSQFMEVMIAIPPHDPSECGASGPRVTNWAHRWSACGSSTSASRPTPEVQSTWGAPASTPATSRKASAFNMHGASKAELASFPSVGAAFAALVKAPTLSGLAKDPSCPNRLCWITDAHLKKGYAVATEAVRLSNVASLLTVYQATLLRDLPECPSVALRTELGTIAQLLVKLAQLNARAQGRSIVSLVVARRQLWLSQARVQEPDKAQLLDAPISPGHTFGPAVEEMLQRSVKAREASQQLAKMWPSKPFQPRRPQERQWRRAPPQQQAQPRGSKTAPSGVSARGQPAFARPQRGGWRPRGGGRPRPRGSGQAPRE